MKFVVRVALGAALGLAAVVGLSFFMEKWWLVGLVGAVTGVVAFLGSFFVWSADRLDEGYEQVLFDLPNSAISLGLVVVLVGAAFGVGLFGSSESSPKLSAEDAAAVAAMGAQREVFHEVLVAYLNEPKSASLAEWATKADAANVATARITAPDSLADVHAALLEESKTIMDTLSAQQNCNGGDAAACADARIAAADAARADAKFVELLSALGG